MVHLTALDLGRRVRPEGRAGARALALRRRRLRQQGRLESPDPCGRRGQLAGRPVRLVLSREGVFRVDRRPHADRAAGGAGRRRATAGSTALIHTGVAAMTHAQRLPRAVHLPGPPPLRRRRRSSIAQKVADIDMVANTFMRAPGESVGTFALEMRDRRAGRVDDRHRPDRAPAAQRAARRTRRRGAPSPRATWSRPTGAGRSGSAGTERSRHPARPARRRMAGRAWGSRPAPIRTTACRAARRAITLDRRRARRRPDGRRTRWAWAPPRCRRSTPPSGWGCRWSRCRFDYGDTDLPAGAMAGGSSQTACDRGGRQRRPARRWSRELLKLAGNDCPLAGLQAGRRRWPVTAVCANARRSGAPRELRLDPGARGERDESTAEASGADAASSCRTIRCTPTGAQFCEVRRQRGDRRDAGQRASSARSTAAASSTPRRRPASSAAASSWGSAWR